MKKFSILTGLVFLLLLVLPLVPEPVCAMTGSGAPGDPYIIYDVTDLQNMILDLDAYYELANDIDASITSTWNGGAGFVPVGTSSIPFTGNFDGKGFFIYALYIDRFTTYDIGLFGYAENATIANVGLVAVDIRGKSSVGALVGDAWETDINDCYSTGT